MPAVLPRALEEKFDELAQQIRWLRLLRGLSWLALTLFATALGAVLLDASFDLPAYARGLLLSGWLLAGGLAAWRLVLRPMREPIPVADLAAAIEEKYPSLAERLYSVVELSEHADPGNGSKALIDVLTRDTAQRTKRLNFFRAAPTGSVVRLALLATVVAVSALAPVLFVTGATERIRRFLLPWYTPRVEVPFKVVVSSGDPVVKRGEAVTLTGYLERTKPDAAIPETAVIVYREAGAEKEKHLPMTGDDKAAFHVTRPGVAADFEYCMEAGPARSEWHKVAVVDPVELADGTAFTVTPPGYAHPTFQEQKHPGLREFEGLQFSKVRFDLKFTRPAVSGAIEWKPGDPNGPFPAERFPVILSGDKAAGTADFTLKADGTLKLILLGEHNVRTEVTVATKAVADAPPKFVKVTGVTEQAQDIRPDDKLPIELAVEDDVKVESVVLEYVLNDQELPLFTVPLPLKDVGTPRAEGTYKFDLAGKAKEGDSVRFRVRAADGRLVSEFNLKPQEVVYPEKGWAELRLRSSARPLAEQEILAQKQKVKDKLDAAAKDARDALNELEQVKKDAAGKPALGVENTVKLESARNKAKEAARALDDLAREAGLTPDLRKLADAVRDVADAPLRQADEAMRKAGNEAAPEPRDKALKDAADKLAEAVAKLNELDEKNDQLARDRLDRKKLEQLAEEQRKLAEEAKRKANDPEALKEIARKQQKLNEELRDILKDNPTLQKAVDEIAREEARDLGDRANKLAADQKALDQAAKENEAKAKQKAFDEVAKKQAELAKKEAELAKKTQTPAKLADSAPADPDQFGKAGEQLAQDKPVEAMTEQEKAARELDRLADALERAVANRKDTKEATRQLARLEDDLRKQFQEATKEQPFDKLPEERRKQMRGQQEAVRKATEKLQGPPNDEAAKKAKQEAVDALAKARDALAGNGENADEAMADAADALRRLGSKLPSREQRLKAAKADLEKLQREQEALSREIEEKLKGAEKQAPDAAARKELAEKLQQAAEKQAELAKKIAELDTPGLDGRKERAAEAAKQAAEDIEKGLSQDIPASQQEARRQTERLKQALDGKKPADELADELAKKQKQLADAADKLTGRPDKGQLQDMQELQREVEKGLESIKDPQAAQRLNRAKEAAKAAADALRTPNDVDELKKKTKEAAAELDKLADDLAGAESDADRAERLAREQQERAEKAKKNAGKPTTPEASAAEQRELERELDDLQRTRAGEAQEAKKKAADALQRLKQNPTPERAPGMQKAAADALKDLADQMKQNGDRSAKQPRPGEQPADKSDDDAGGQLPSKADARQAREMAKEQRELKDRLNKANEQAKQPTKPTDNAAVEKLAKEQEQLAKEAADAAKEAGAEAGKAGRQAAEEAQKAADQLKAGAPAQAQAAGEKAGEQLDKMAQAAGNGPAGKKAKELAEKQKRLNGQMAEAAKDAGAAAAQQKARQDELAKEAGELADKLDRAAKSPATDSKKVDRDALQKAAAAAKEAQKEMDRAAREQAAGRPNGAEQAREKANDALERAAGHANAATGQKPGDKRPDPNARDAGKAAQQADAKQRDGKQRAEKGDGKQAGEAMQQAADDLGKAAGALAKAGGQGDGSGEGGKGGGQGGGDKPAGGVDPNGKDPTKADLPADVAQYLGKPWGELPGDVKAKIIQDLKAKYGEDYARVIKLYFEQIADRK